ncbi:MAG TPA: hypothetical protein VF395_18250, partial [Polyangiaceae bacterium]
MIPRRERPLHVRAHLERPGHDHRNERRDAVVWGSVRRALSKGVSSISGAGSDGQQHTDHEEGDGRKSRYHRQPEDQERRDAECPRYPEEL